ncbi:MAG: hypothetical protein AAGC81_18745 [Pseudomonadota bacterium]
MKILSLDISKTGCGMGQGDGSCPPHTSVTSFDQEDVFDAGAAFDRWLTGEILNYGPDAIWAEAPLPAAAQRHTHNSERSIRIQNGLYFIAGTVARKRKILFRSVAVSTWRSSFVGKSNPVDPKLATMRMCDLLGWPHGGDDNRADSAGIWAHAHIKEGNAPGVRQMLSRGSVRRMAG